MSRTSNFFCFRFASTVKKEKYFLIWENIYKHNTTGVAEFDNFTGIIEDINRKKILLKSVKNLWSMLVVCVFYV